MSIAQTVNFLIALLKLSNPKPIIRILVKSVDSSIIKHICELAFNFLNNRSLSLDNDCLRRIAQRKKVFTQLADRKRSIADKRRIIAKGGRDLLEDLVHIYTKCQ
jgi:hypothetical protein